MKTTLMPVEMNAKGIPAAFVIPIAMDCHGGPEILWRIADWPISKEQTAVRQVLRTSHRHECRRSSGALAVEQGRNPEPAEVSYAK